MQCGLPPLAVDSQPPNGILYDSPGQRTGFYLFNVFTEAVLCRCRGRCCLPVTLVDVICHGKGMH